ncbi:toll/interleukin-1 receptor domain-containing protein, partial [Streptomyces sp. T21Q-yed]
DALALTRALRPLRQTVPSTRARTLDVEATAAASGDTGLLLPILRPAPERRFSVDLLIDTGTTMKVWHRLADELRTLLARHGAFADVRAWALQTDGPEPTLAPFRRSGAQAASTVRRWRQALTDPAGRRAVLVLTDGVGPSWYGTELPAALADWSVRRPVAALQVLPGRLWHRTALRTSAVRARGTQTDRATIEVRSSGPLPGIARGRAGAEDRARIRWLPVLEVSGDWLSPWARLVSGRTTDWLPLRAAALTVVERPSPVGPGDEPSSPAAWIERFEEGYSPEAFRLLRLLAAAPLSLPVMRLVQRTMLPASTPMHLAEVFLSGLLVRRTPIEPGGDPDSVLYDFRDGVRDALLERLSRTESLRVLTQVVDGVSERVAKTFGGVTDFGALLASAGEVGGLDGRELPEGSRAFAEVAWAVIAGVGGDHAEIVEKLTRGRVGEAAPAQPESALEQTEKEPRERRPRLFSRWRRNRGREPEGAMAVGDVGPVELGERVPSRMPPLPPFYIRRDEFSDVLDVILKGNRSGYRRKPLQYGTRCVIEGAQGIGKTALAIDCAQAFARTFTMVRWIRAYNGEVLLEDLTALSDDLGLPSPADRAESRLGPLFDYLRDNPGWLLIYDGVTSEAFVTRPGSAPSFLWLPPYAGSLLITVSEGTPWRNRAHEALETVTVTLGNLSRESAVNYLQGALARYRGELWHDVAELNRLVDVTGTNPRMLTQVASTFETGPWTGSDPVQWMLVGRPEINRFLDSLVWITEADVVIGTGIAVRSDAVLTTVFRPRRGVLCHVHARSGPPLPVRGSWVRSDHPELFMLRVDEGILPAAPLAHPDDRAVAAAWWEKFGKGSATVMMGHAESRAHPPPPGAALIDANGRLRSIAAQSAEGGARIDITSAFVEGFSWQDGLKTETRDREWELTPPDAPQRRPMFYLSCARSHGESLDSVRHFFDDLCDVLLELSSARSAPGYGPGFDFSGGVLPGMRWDGPTQRALAGAQVFVPLYSPQYFKDERCGREWDAFSRRQVREKRSAIVPVFWTPVGPVPPLARNLALRSRSRDYTRRGLMALWESDRVEYYRAVREIAEGIVAVAQATRLSPCEPSLFNGLRNVFEEEQA